MNKKKKSILTKLLLEIAQTQPSSFAYFCAPNQVTKRMGPFTHDYNHTEENDPHVQRCREIIKKYPQVKELMGRNPQSIWYIIGIVVFQVFIAYMVRDLAWYWVLLAAWCIGAFANHALFVMIHECTHNMVLKSRLGNLWAGILCDLPNAFPSSAGFRKYHLKHHAFQGHYELDADIPSIWEAKLIGTGFIGKTIWLLLFPVFQGLRPPRLKEISFANKWIWINLVSVIIFDVLVWMFIGPMALLYLAASFFFSIGLHPLGGRWIQEHYLVAPPQETYSYYGPLNKLAFNVGYHNEHHDFAYIPWNNLPKLRAIAPEYYDTLYYHTSWAKLTWKFLTDKELSLFSRSVRSERSVVDVSSSGEADYTKRREIMEESSAA